MPAWDPPMAGKVRVGDTGAAIIPDCGQDLGAATARWIELRKPDGTAACRAAVASGTDSIRFDTLAGSLDQVGKWRLQARVTLPSGLWLGATAELVVYAASG